MMVMPLKSSNHLWVDDMDDVLKPDTLKIADKTFSSRLLIGSSMYPNQQVMLDSIAASGAQIVTVAIRRINLQGQHLSVQSLLKDRNLTLLPNTAGCYTAQDAIFTAELAREALQTNWIKLEVIGERETLMPDVVELLQAAETLVKSGFVVLPYCTDDPIMCQRLVDVGCAAVMPLGSPIGSGQGILNRYNLDIIRTQISLPIILDAGIGTASDAAIAMEHGCDAILLNTAIAKSDNPVLMASAMRKGMEGGREAYRAGRIAKKTHAQASSPMDGLVASRTT
jgi:thiazole synthase